MVGVASRCGAIPDLNLSRERTEDFAHGMRERGKRTGLPLVVASPLVKSTHLPVPPHSICPRRFWNSWFVLPAVHVQIWSLTPLTVEPLGTSRHLLPNVCSWPVRGPTGMVQVLLPLGKVVWKSEFRQPTRATSAPFVSDAAVIQ